MNVESVKVVSLFKNIEKIQSTLDPMTELLQEGEVEVVSESKRRPISYVVTENHFPDQSIYILDEQLSALKKRLNRMKFYMGELNDLLPN